MDNKFDILPNRLLELADEFHADVKIDQLNLHDLNMKCPALKSKWVMMYLAEKKYLTQLKEVKEQLLDKYIKQHGQPKIPKKVLEQQAKRELADSNDLKKVDKAISDQLMVVEYLENANKIILGMSFDLKNCMDLLKLES